MMEAGIFAHAKTLSRKEEEEKFWRFGVSNSPLVG
jgi:hypothetical protein